MHDAGELVRRQSTGRLLELAHRPFKGFELKTPCTLTEVAAEAFPDSHIVKVGKPNRLSEESRKDGRTKKVGERERLALVVGPVRGLLLRDPGREELGCDEPEK